MVFVNPELFPENSYVMDKLKIVSSLLSRDEGSEAVRGGDMDQKREL